MNNYICIGKIVNTFGIKGELKVISDFEFQSRVFIKDFTLFIGEEKVKEVINTWRIHKNNYLLLFNNYSNINEVLKYKGKKIYINRNDLKLNKNEYLLNDLIGYSVYDKDKLLGIVVDYEKNINNILFKVKGDKSFYLPYIDEYILEIDNINKKIITNNGGNLII